MECVITTRPQAVELDPNVSMTGTYGSQKGPVHFHVEFPRESPDDGVRKLAAWFVEQMRQEEVPADEQKELLNLAKNVMIDRFCTLVPESDWEHLAAVWDGITKKETT